jgi:ectoine hydroxylase-related dioxygenase (phytanoyl-CoA dioxygenase family)
MAPTEVLPEADAAAFHHFHHVDLPERLAGGNGALACSAVGSLGSLGLVTPAGAYTYEPVDGTILIEPGADRADTVIELDLDAWAGLIADLETAPGLFYGGRAMATRGKAMRFVAWEPGLRAMYHGLAPFDPAVADLRDRDGGPLDPSRSFTIADARERPEELRHFLTTAGYLVVRGVFDGDEVDALLADTRVRHDEAVPGDGASWWGRTSTGDEVLCRVLNANRFERFRGLSDDDRIQLLRSVVPEDLVGRDPDALDSGTVLWKLPDVTEGLADLPWHRDCGLGGHALNCPTVIVTICLTEGTPEAGELRVLPGSHRGTFPFVDGRAETAPEGVAVRVGAGDVSLHYSDLMHASLPPTSATGPHRISALLAFVPPDGGHHRGERHYNDVLLGRDDGQIEDLAHRVG